MSEQPNEQASSAEFEFSALDRAVNYRAALLREFSSALQGRVVEVGAGIGQFTAGLSSWPGVSQVVGVEPEAEFCATFRRLHPALSLVEGTIDQLGGDCGWNALVCINVLEHIREDEAELRKFHARLRPQSGRLCLFVPARQEIYAPLDADFGHFRRYAKPELRAKLERAGFHIERLHYFNSIGYFAWWWNFCVLKKRQFDTGSVTLFDRFIFPPVHALERIIRPPFGQSLLAIAQARA